MYAFDSHKRMRLSYTSFSSYTFFRVRRFHNGEYNEWVNDQISFFNRSKDVFLPGEELNSFYECLDKIYDKLVEDKIIDPELLPESALHLIKERILSPSGHFTRLRVVAKEFLLQFKS